MNAYEQNFILHEAGGPAKHAVWYSILAYFGLDRNYMTVSKKNWFCMKHVVRESMEFDFVCWCSPSTRRGSTTTFRTEAVGVT